MKRILMFFNIFLLIFSIFLINNQNFKVFADSYVLFKGEIEHLFTHCLIAYPDIACAKNNSMKKYYLEDCITPDEFRAVLNELYQNDYVLVDINTIYKVEEDRVKKGKLYLPKNKKPLIFSFDDVNYDSKKIGKGMVDKLIIQDGEIYSSTIINGKEDIRDDVEFVCILENFIKDNPDFSFNGARGTLCLTGYDGVLGYRTSSRNKINREEEIKKAKEVVKVLKQKGWNFACHSFGHYHMKKISLEKFKEELELWDKEVKPIIGETSVYVYPYGEWEIYDSEYNFTEKHKLLLQNGFKLFCGVGMKNFFSFLPYQKSDVPKSLFIDRKSIDGFSLENRQEELKHLFSTKDVLDKKYRK